MRRVLFLFLDGVGLGLDDPQVNPLAAAALPTFSALFDGRPLTASTGRFSRDDAHLIPTDAHLGVPGRPQSATGQTAILTGVNAPARLGEHYGPRPDQRVRDILDEAGIFARLHAAGHATAYVNAYPQGYFDAVNRGQTPAERSPLRGKRRRSPTADIERYGSATGPVRQLHRPGLAHAVGLSRCAALLAAGGRRAVLAPCPARALRLFRALADRLLGASYRDLRGAIENFEHIDGFLAGLLEVMDWQETLLIIASDHGNVEDCTIRKHTENQALTVLVGGRAAAYAQRIHRLDNFVDIVADFLDEKDIVGDFLTMPW